MSVLSTKAMFRKPLTGQRTGGFPIPYKHAQKLAALLHTIPSHFMKPNNETCEAMAELGEGKGERFASAEKLVEGLGI